MLIAVLDAAGVIIRIEEITEKGIAEGYRPEEEWVEAAEDWEAGGTFKDGKYIAPIEPVVVPDRVTARQFKLQLLAAGLLDQVEGWIASQSRAVQIAYANSGTFVRDEPMMQAGFAALDFTPQQGDIFFTEAASL